MQTLQIPHDGMELGQALELDNGIAALPQQIVQLDLARGTLQRLIKEAREGKSKISLTSGKSTLSLYYSNKPHSLSTVTCSPGTEFYKVHQDSSILLGSLSHKLEVNRGQGLVVQEDAALQALRDSMAEAARKKQANQTAFVKDNSSLPPMKGEKRGASKKKATAAFFKPAHRNQLNGGSISRSITASPALGASRSPFLFGASQTSVPAASSQEALKAAALKSAMLHVLAIGPTTLKGIAKKIRCSPSECEKLFSLYAQPSRDDPSKSDLDPKAYKELDIWKFPYQSDGDRQSAIDRAVKAFDKLRITPSDQLWQQLLPKHDRGKGISLSKLDFRNGPLQRVSTPIIHVEHTDHANFTDTSDGKSHKQSRLHPRDDETESLSPATGPVKKRKITDKEAQMKRLSKNPPKNPPKKAAAKEPKAKKEPKAPAREKKEGKKGSPKITPKIKSAEFVHDSDEDEVMEDFVPEKAIGKASTNSASQSKSKAPTKATTKSALNTDADSSAESSAKSAKLGGMKTKKGVDEAPEKPPVKASIGKPIKGAEDKLASKPIAKVNGNADSKLDTKPTAKSTHKAEDQAEAKMERKSAPATKPAPKVHSPMLKITKLNVRREVVPDARAVNGNQQKKMNLKKVAVEGKGVSGKKGDVGKREVTEKRAVLDKNDAKRKQILAAAEKKGSSTNSPQAKVGNSPNPTATASTRPSASTIRGTFAHQRNTSSPMKPSPLALSPPTNASELDHKLPGYQASSTKTTPSGSSSGTKDSPPVQPAHPKGVARQIGPPTSNPVSVKRKADAMDNEAAKAKVNGIRSTAMQEAKAAIFGRVPNSNPASPHPNKKHQTHHPSIANGHLGTPTTKSTVTGKSPDPPKVIQKPPTPSPSPSLSESASPSPASLLGESRVEKGLRFKKYYAEYEKLHLRLEATEVADRDKKQMEKLKRMRQVLMDLKADIASKG